jgi:hypothetical protein
MPSLHRHEHLDAPRRAHGLGTELRGHKVRRPVIRRHARRLPWVLVDRLVAGHAAIANDVSVPIDVPAARVLVLNAIGVTSERHSWWWQRRRWWRVRCCWRWQRRRVCCCWRRCLLRCRTRWRGGCCRAGRRVEVERGWLVQQCPDLRRRGRATLAQRHTSCLTTEPLLPMMLWMRLPMYFASSCEISGLCSAPVTRYAEASYWSHA